VLYHNIANLWLYTLREIQEKMPAFYAVVEVHENIFSKSRGRLIHVAMVIHVPIYMYIFFTFECCPRFSREGVIPWKGLAQTLPQM
jgi:hypothetical protein